MGTAIWNNLGVSEVFRRILAILATATVALSAAAALAADSPAGQAAGTPPGGQPPQVKGAAKPLPPELWDRPRYPSAQVCFEAEKMPCAELTDGTWMNVALAGTPKEIQGDPILAFSDIRLIQESKIAMIEGTSGEPGYPVVAVDRKQVNFPDARPQIDPATGRTMLPVRFVGEALGAQVTWDEAARTATLVRGGTTVVLRPDANTALVNGQPRDLDAPLRIVPPGRILAPLRFVAEAFGLNVDWVGDQPPPYRPGWPGRWQVWIWDPDGYWGPYTLEDRLFLGQIEARPKEVGAYKWHCDNKIYQLGSVIEQQKAMRKVYPELLTVSVWGGPERCTEFYTRFAKYGVVADVR